LAVIGIVYPTVATNVEAPDVLIFVRKSREHQTEQETVFPATLSKSSCTVSPRTSLVFTTVILQTQKKLLS